MIEEDWVYQSKSLLITQPQLTLSCGTVSEAFLHALALHCVILRGGLCCCLTYLARHSMRLWPRSECHHSDHTKIPPSNRCHRSSHGGKCRGTPPHTVVAKMIRTLLFQFFFSLAQVRRLWRQLYPNSSTRLCVVLLMPWPQPQSIPCEVHPNSWIDFAWQSS